MIDPQAAKSVQVLFLDCDGVLTDGRMIYQDRPTVAMTGDSVDDAREAKSFHVRDGMAAVLMRLAGLKLVLITGEPSPAARRRATKLKLDGVLLGIDDKRPAAEAWLTEHGYRFDQAAHVGDEINDLGLMRAVPLSLAPADANPIVHREATVTLQTAGGDGVLREVCGDLLEARGELQETIERYIAGERP